MLVPEEMMSRYFDRRKLDLDECLKNLREGKISLIEKIGHQLKGNAVTFGHPELSEIGKELESAAKSGSQADMAFVIEKFRNWVELHTS